MFLKTSMKNAKGKMQKEKEEIAFISRRGK